MSQNADLDSENDASFNFWEPKQYNKTVKRLENSYKLCQELSNLVIERAEIEKLYSNNLKKWSNKLMISLEGSVEYGTSKAGWNSFSKEAEEISEIHMDIRNKLLEEIQPSIKHWQKDHFHKVTLPTPHYKEIKNLETDFEYAQKPWCKKLKKSNICKKDYYTYCKQEKTLNIQLQNSRNDTVVTADQLKKIEDRYKKAEKDMEKALTSYQASVQDLDGDSSRYMEEMDKIFKKSQVMEQERKEYFKDIFEKTRCILNTSKNPQLKEVYDHFELGINEMNCDLDLKNWSNSYGASMLFQVPKFEEYIPELSGMVNKKVVASNQGGITLTSVTSTRDSSPASKSHDSRDDPKKTTQQASLPLAYNESLNPFNASDDCHNNNYNNAAVDEEYDTVIVDDKAPGVKVRALFDYVGAEEDELSLKAGEIFERLQEADEQGWCKGRQNGVVGLYPANYAEPL